MRSIYDILQVSEDATFQEMQEKYQSLKAEYSEGRFQAGEKGNESAKLLNELETAWQMVKEKQKIVENTKSGTDYEYIDKLIKSKEYDKAQDLLDEINDRNGMWHYLQSIIFYKREWLSESREQLVAALECEPGNEKYKTALEKLDMVIGSANTKAENLNNGGNPNVNPTMQQQQQMDALSNCCLCYCLTNLCCDCTRCCGM